MPKSSIYTQMNGSLNSLQYLLSSRPSLNSKKKRLVLSFLLTLLRDFFLAYGVRGGIRLIPLLFKSIQTGQFSIGKILGESFGKEVGRFGLFVALYFSSFKLTEQLICYWRAGRKDRWNALFAGAVASLSLAVMRGDEQFRWTLAQYLAMRAAQCLYNHWCRAHPHLKRFFYYGDVGLFSFSSAQLMYGYFVRPETLDADYRKFVGRFAAVEEGLVACGRQVYKQGRVELVDLLTATFTLPEGAKVDFLQLEAAKALPCSLFHYDCGCWERIVLLWIRTFRQSAPMYFSLHLIPSLLFKYYGFIKDPAFQLSHSVKNTVQSSCFLASSAAAFQALLCAKSACFPEAHWKYSYWLIGAMAGGLGVLIEKKPRRSELSLYLLPKALQALYRAMIDRKLMVRIPRGDFLLFSGAMAVLMSYYRDEPESVTPIVSKIFSKFL